MGQATLSKERLFSCEHYPALLFWSFSTAGIVFIFGIVSTYCCLIRYYKKSITLLSRKKYILFYSILFYLYRFLYTCKFLELMRDNWKTWENTLERIWEGVHIYKLSKPPACSFMKNWKVWKTRRTCFTEHPGLSAYNFC